MHTHSFYSERNQSVAMEITKEVSVRNANTKDKEEQSILSYVTTYTLAIATH